MSGKYELKAEIRSVKGKGASRRLRRDGEQLPAIIYGGEKDSIPLTLNHREVMKALENEAFYSHILTLHVNGQKEKVVLKDLQRHPYKPRMVHMDFLRVGHQKITMHVPIHFLGGDVAPGVKTGGGIVSHLMTSVDVRCMPDDLPEYLEVDISKLDLNESIHLSQIKLPKGVEILQLAHGVEHDLPVVNIHVPRAVIEEEVVTEVVETEEAAEATAAEGTTAAPAKGGEKKPEGK